MRCRWPLPLKMVCLVENSLLFNHNHLNISCPDIPCVLGNGVGGATGSTQPVTHCMTVNIILSNLYNSLLSIPTEDHVSPPEEVIIPGRIQFPAPEHFLPLSHHQTVEPQAGHTIPQSREEISPTTVVLRIPVLLSADQAMKRIDRSNTWQGAVGRIKWVMGTLSPIAEVRVVPFDVLGRADVHT
jgi:hypothetical protein